MFDLKISSVACTIRLSNDLVVRSLACWVPMLKTVFLGNWPDENHQNFPSSGGSFRPDDDRVRVSDPFAAVLAPLFHEFVHDAICTVESDQTSWLFDYTFFLTRMEDELGMPDWKPCFYCGGRMEFPENSAVCRRCHEGELNLL